MLALFFQNLIFFQNSIRTVVFASCAIFFLCFLCPSLAQASEIGTSLPIWSVFPFVGILFSIALFPVWAPKIWHIHFGKISAFWALVFAIPFLFFYQEIAFNEILHIIVLDYIPFIILLWGLFTVSSGIVIRGKFNGTPIFNTTTLLIGTLLASCIGTTGASIVMIRPLLRANKDRIHRTHIVCFFIFLVANIGGSLTPLGDPPLFLGFLHNVPFFWVTINLFPTMFFTVTILLVLFYFMDIHFYRKETELHKVVLHKTKTKIHIDGAYNLIFLLGIVVVLLTSSYWKVSAVNVFGISVSYQSILRDIAIIVLGIISLSVTPKILHKANEFSWLAIIEVAKLFIGIFITIIPVLAILKAGSAGALANFVNSVETPMEYFWASGILSSFLDNAPTYLVFFNMALGHTGITEAQIPVTLTLGAKTTGQAFISFLRAISLGTVFMGAMTYIGNAPNFMIRTIAKEAGVKLPSFFGYMFKYSIPILIPVLILVSFIFF
ncbi:MAG: sodium:proton antiporter [Deltaproteobacteria bacterium]